MLIEHLRMRYPDQSAEFTETRFDAGEIDLDRYPIDRGQDVRERERASATQPHDAASHPARESAGSRFDDPFLNRLLEAVSAEIRRLSGRLRSRSCNRRAEKLFSDRVDSLWRKQLETRESPGQSVTVDQIQAAARG